MIIVDIDNPESCLDCRLRRCGNCIPVGEDVSKYLTTERLITKFKPDWCPIIFEIPDEHMEEVIECLRS